MTVNLSDYRAPGVEVNERIATPVLTGAQFAVAGFVGVCRRGPTDKYQDVGSWEEFNSKYGGGEYRGFYGDHYLPYAVREFFRENKGQLARIVRVMTDAGDTVAATYIFNGLQVALPDPTLTVDAKYHGAWGNDVSVITQKYDVALAALVLNAATEATLVSVADIEIGDLVEIYDGTAHAHVYVHDIDTATSKIKFGTATVIGGASVAATGSVRCATTHLCKTRLTAPLATGATQAILEDATGLSIGSRVYVGGVGEDDIELLVTGKSGNTINFGALAAMTTITVPNGVVASQEFDFYVLDNGDYVESWTGVSMEDTNELNFVEERLSGTNNQSDYVSLTDMDYSALGYWAEAIPIINGTSLAGGTDSTGGTAVDEDDIVGSDTSPKTGLYLLDGVEIDYVSAPGYNTQTVARAFLSWVKTRKDCVYIHSHAYSDDTVELIRNFKSKTVNYPTSYGAMYSPWLEITHPYKTGKTIWVPPDGWVCAEAAYVARIFGLHYPPANTILAGNIQKLSLYLGDSDAAHLGTLNHEGINMIRFFEGEGYRIFGARTESQLQNGFHWLNIRIYINWIKRSLRKFLRGYALRPNMQAYRSEIQETIFDFFEGEWELGHLVPEDDKANAFFVQCNKENNPVRLINRGHLIVDVGVQPPPPAEFVTLNVSLFKGGTVSVAEGTISN